MIVLLSVAASIGNDSSTICSSFIGNDSSTFCIVNPIKVTRVILYEFSQSLEIMEVNVIMLHSPSII